MKKLFFALTFLCSSLAYADVILETVIDKIAFDAVILSDENPVAHYTVGEQQYKITLTKVEQEEAVETVQCDVHIITHEEATLIAQPTFKKEHGSLATLTLQDDEHSLTLSIR